MTPICQLVSVLKTLEQTIERCTIARSAIVINVGSSGSNVQI